MSLKSLMHTLKKALSWQSIKPADLKGLQAFVLYPRECCNVMEELLILASNCRSLTIKLPYELRERWRIEVSELHEKGNS